MSGSLTYPPGPFPAPGTRIARTDQEWRTLHGGRVIPVHSEIALRAGDLIAKAKAEGFEIAAEDALIGATADVRGLTVLTENERHFRPLGVTFVNPFDNTAAGRPATPPGDLKRTSDISILHR